MLFAPLSEVPAIGRNIVYIPALFMFVVLQIPTALVRNIGSLIVLRAITGFLSSPPLANGGASMGDVLHPSQLPYGIAIWASAAVMGPVGGPLLGGVFSQVENWRWTFWCLMWISGFALVVLFFFLPETSASTILHRRARRLRIRTGDPRYTTKAELEYKGLNKREVAKESLIRPFFITFMEPGVFFLNCYTALIYAVMYTWFEAFPIVFQQTHHFNLIETGLSYMGILIGCSIACAIYCCVIRYYIIPQLMAGAQPEMLFTVAFFAAPLLPGAIFFFGWTSSASIPWIVPIIASGLFIIGGFIIFQVIFNYLGMSYPRYLASVFAGNDLFRSCFAAAFPLFARAMFNNLGPTRFPVGFGSTILGCFSALMILIPIVLIRNGHTLRAKSKYAN